jgi:hypothetical protein
VTQTLNYFDAVLRPSLQSGATLRRLDRDPSLLTFRN